MKTHDREFFYKYLGAEGALATLSRRTARWSSPLRFNDPFDTHFGLTFGFSVDDIPGVLGPRLKALVRSDGPLSPGASKMVTRAVELARENRRRGAPDDMTISATDLQAGVENARRYLADANKKWQSQLRTKRLYCVSEVYDDLLMWAHYADCHRGAVIRLRCLPEKDSVLCGALPVMYQSRIPVVAETADEWVAHLCGDKRLDLGGHFTRLISAKSQHWSYEKEWRCLDEDADTGLPDLQLFTDIDLYAEEISGVYLGCQIADRDRNELVRIVKSELSHAQMFQARRSTSAFALDFEEIHQNSPGF